MYQTAFAQWLNKRYEKQVLAHADKVLTVSDDCRRLFEAKITPKYPIVVLPNGYDPDDFTNVPMQKQTHKFVLSYVGVFSEQYRIDVLIDALTHLAPKWADKVMLQFVGVVKLVLGIHLVILYLILN